MAEPNQESGQGRLGSSITLEELFAFIQWMAKAEAALEKADPLPDPPPLAPGTVARWIALIGKLKEESRQMERRHLALEATLREHTRQMGPLVSNLCENLATLYDSMGESEKAKVVRMRAAALNVF